MRPALIALLAGTDTLRRQLRLVDALRLQGSLTVGPTESRTRTEDAVWEVQRQLGSPAELASYYYNATVVSLYGLLERYVEDLLADVVRLAAKAVPSSAQLPDRIRSHHLALTLEVLAAIQGNRYRGSADASTLIRTLHRYLDGTTGVHVNDVVFMHHTANFRADVVRQSFERVGFSPLPALKADKGFGLVVDDRFPDEDNPFYVIDDLAERRNEVAHGSPPQQLLTTAILLDYIDVVKEYLSALSRAAMGYVTSLVIQHEGQPLGRPDRVFKKSIVGYEALPVSLSRGQTLGVASGVAAYCVEVESIHVQDEPREDAAVGQSAGLALSSEVSGRARLFLLPGWASALVSL